MDFVKNFRNTLLSKCCLFRCERACIKLFLGIIVNKYALHCLISNVNKVIVYEYIKDIHVFLKPIHTR